VTSEIDHARQLFQSGRRAEALARLDRRLAQAPDDLPVGLERSRLALLAGDRAGARAGLEAILARSGEQPAALAQLAVLQELEGAGDSALALARRALALDPGEPLAAALAVRLLTDRCQAAAAIAVAEACLEREPQAAPVRRGLAAALLFQGRAPEASVAALAATEGLPGDPAAVGTALIASLYDETLGPAARAARHRQLAATIAPARCPAPLQPARSGRLRVGFYSADFRRHPVGLLIQPILEQLDRGRFDPYCYAQLEQRDDVTQALRALPLAWREVTGADDDDVLALMRADRLDVLVDLAGHSHGGRPCVVRGRAAPVQLAWLGYPHGSGLPEIDGLVGDPVVLPPGCEAQYLEPLLRLPDGLFCLQASDELPPVAPLPMLATGGPTLASFNHLAKLSDRTVALWSRLLHAVPDARLLLCAIPLLDADTRAFTARRFADRGIGADRLELRPPQAPGPGFLRQYDAVDLALDPLPFSGGATTLDALRQGVPVLTRAGDGLHSRMAASVLHQLGLDEWIAADEDAYLAIAVDWLRRPDDLAVLRRGLRPRFARARAGDADRYTRQFERLLLAAAGRT
jgi:predicted O-linked N-acetylglucosamine transferase (SPINDLY family)